MGTSLALDSLVQERRTAIAGLKVSSAAEREPFLNLLIYGDPGAGKTVLAGSASVVPEMAPVLIVDVEGGTFSLRSFYPDIDVVRVASFTDLQKVYDELRRGNSGYRTIVIDSLTELQKFSMMLIMRDLLQEHADRDPDVPSVREWGKSIEQIRRVVRGFRDLPMNTIFTCLAQSDKNQLTGKITTGPSLPGKLAKEIAGFVDIVAYLYWKNSKEGRKQFLLTGITEDHIAKDRSAKLPLAIEDPTLQGMYNLIFND